MNPGDFLSESRRQRLEAAWGPRPLGPLAVRLTALGLALVFWFGFRTPTFPAEPSPKGLALLFPGDNFTWLHVDPLFRLGQAPFTVFDLGMLALCALLACNRLLWLALPLIAILHLSLGTLANSQQAEPGHKYQLVALAALTLWAWDWFARWRRRRELPRQGWRLTAPNSARWWSVAGWLVVQVVAAGYLVSVVSKVVLSGGEWVQQTGNYPIQLHKTAMAHYYGTLEGAPPGQLDFEVTADEETPAALQADQARPPATAATAPPLARFGLATRRWIVETPYAASVLLTFGLLMETLSFLALRGRLWGVVTGLGLIGMHLGIQVLMQLNFEFHIALVALFFVNLPFWIETGLRRLRGPERRK